MKSGDRRSCRSGVVSITAPIVGDHDDDDDDCGLVVDFGTVKANVPERRKEAATITFMVGY